MYPITTFTALTICGTKENALKFDDNHVSFRAMLNIQSTKNRPIYTFNAFDSVMERIKKMKIGYKSEVCIVAELRDWIDKNNNRQYSFMILSIDYLRTDKSLTAQNDHERPKTEAVEKNTTTPVTSPQPSKPAETALEKSKKKMPEEYYDIEVFSKMYGGN